MALLKTVNVTLALNELIINKASDRWRGVEPYIVPVFFKVDGERYEATLRILNARDPREGSTERPPEPGGVFQFSLDSLHPDPTKDNVPEKDYPYIFVPPGKLLGRGSNHDAGSKIDISDVLFTTNLEPIAFKIDVLGLSDINSIMSALQGLLVAEEDNDEDGLNGVLNTFYNGFNATIAGLLGLSVELESCPPLDKEDLEDFFKNFEAQFNCLIPGTVAGVFTCMENDEFSESLAKDLQDSIREEVENSINDTVNAVARNNPIPDPDHYQDEDISLENVISDLTGPVILSFLWGFGLFLFGVATLNIGLALYGLFSSASWLLGGQDDAVGTYSVAFDHGVLLDLSLNNTPYKFSSDPDDINPDEDDLVVVTDAGDLIAEGNDWKVKGTLMVNQPTLPVALPN